ncbi:DUF1365 family protein [uncultured Cohaesibacter sp.]|uniref:DUF1365 domain-containing protein n=1 Tax=uncultured Cohaesibacter sp. TaxID=1002546 RepID=UPI00292F283D|nr:DUF1365 family protein [uncultured Cohaesibacter sp.]
MKDPNVFAPRPCLYQGLVTHSRRGALEHRLAYRVTSLLLPLDSLEDARGRSALFSVNKFNLISFHEKDHMEEGFANLQDYLTHLLTISGEFQPGDQLPKRFSLLTFPRLLGHSFNPLTLVFCCDETDRLQAIIYQVSNTFGQRHHYIYRIPPEDADCAQKERLHHEGEKKFYVSPFLEIEGKYKFSIKLPHEKLSYSIQLIGKQPSTLVATFVARRRPLTTGNLLSTFVISLQSGWKILATIHIEAFRLWRKGAPFYRRPPKPEEKITALHRSNLFAKDHLHDVAE